MEYLSTAEAAAYLGYTLATLRRYISQGKLAPDIRIGALPYGTPGFTRETLDAFKRGRQQVGRRKVALTPEQWAEAGRRFHAGEVLSKVAADYGVSPETLHRKVGARKKANGAG